MSQAHLVRWTRLKYLATVICCSRINLCENSLLSILSWLALGRFRLRVPVLQWILQLTNKTSELLEGFAKPQHLFLSIVSIDVCVYRCLQSISLIIMNYNQVVCSLDWAHLHSCPQSSWQGMNIEFVWIVFYSRVWKYGRVSSHMLLLFCKMSIKVNPSLEPLVIAFYPDISLGDPKSQVTCNCWDNFLDTSHTHRTSKSNFVHSDSQL